MTKQDSERFVLELGVLAEALDMPVSEARALLYFETLAEYPLETVCLAFRAARRQKWFRFPQPGELIEVIDGNIDDRAEQAWQAMGRALRAVGPWESVTFEDGRAGAVVVAVFGGWPEAYTAWTDLSEPAWQGKRKEFLACYRGMLRRGTKDILQSLPGIAESQNSLHGFSGERQGALVGARVDQPALSESSGTLRIQPTVAVQESGDEPGMMREPS